jgi:hypothetical protein
MARPNRTLLLALALVLVSILTVHFAARGVRHARELRGRAGEPIQPWMNVGFIAHAYHVPPEVIHQALGLPHDRPDRRPLWRIARAQGRSTDELIAELNAALAEARAPQPPPVGTPPAPPGAPRPQP